MDSQRNTQMSNSAAGVPTKLNVMDDNFERPLKFGKFEASESAVNVTNEVNSEDLTLDSTRKTEHYTMAAANVQTSNSTAGIIAVNSTVQVTGDVNVNTQSSKVPDISEFQVPPCITTFRGREDKMNELTSLFFTHNHKKVLICGQAGIGKTETAKQFAKKALNDKHIDKIFWINAEGKHNIEASFKDLAKHCKVPDTDVKYIFKHNKTFKCLYIFDNGESRNQIVRFMPPEDQFVLVTSQVQSWGADFKRIELSTLTSDGALLVVQSILAEHYKEEYISQYRQLADIVCNVPLGLQVIAGYLYDYECDELSINIEEYIEDLKQSIMHRNICPTLPNEYEYSIYGAVSLTLEKMRNSKYVDSETCNLVFIFLSSCSFLNPDNIYLNTIKGIIKENNCSEYNFNLILNLAVKFSIIGLSSDGKLQVHRLMQRILRVFFREKYADIQKQSYIMCLKSDIIYHWFYGSSIISYADENLDEFFAFSKEYLDKIKSNEIVSINYTYVHISQMLVECGCKETLKKFSNTLRIIKVFILIIVNY